MPCAVAWQIFILITDCDQKYFTYSPMPLILPVWFSKNYIRVTSIPKNS